MEGVGLAKLEEEVEGTDSITDFQRAETDLHSPWQ